MAATVTGERGFGVRKPFNLAVYAVVGGLAAGTAQAAEVFRDDFDGDALDAHWEVVNPDPENFIVDDGALLALYSRQSSIDNGHMMNLFLLRSPPPQGDWQATIRLRPEFQTMREVMYFGLFEDQANYVMSATYVSSWCCYARNLSIAATKNAKGKKAQYAAALSPSFDHGEGAFDAYRKSFEKLGDGILVRLVKTDRAYVFSGRIEGMDEDGEPYPWVQLSKLILLRQKGNLVFGFTQSRGGDRHRGNGGESVVNVDWVKIETVD